MRMFYSLYYWDVMRAKYDGVWRALAFVLSLLIELLVMMGIVDGL